MANVALQDAVSVVNLATLKAIPSSDRVDKSLRIVVSPGTNLPPSWYQFDAEATLSELSPAIVAPTSGTGRWIMVGTPLVVSSVAPSSVPPLVGMRWIKGSQIWQSVGTGDPTDWVEVTSGVTP